MSSEVPVCSIHVAGEGDAVVIATLGDVKASTCSIKLAKTWLGGRAGVIDGYLSFEAAARAVVEGEADCILIPGAYPDLRRHIFSTDLVFLDTFRGVLPPMVLVESPDPLVVRSRDLYFHPALRELVNQLREDNGHIDQHEVTSNAVACERVLENPAGYALTNRIAAQEYGVRELKVMRKDWPIPVVLFEGAKTMSVSARGGLNNAAG